MSLTIFFIFNINSWFFILSKINILPKSNWLLCDSDKIMIPRNFASQTKNLINSDALVFSQKNLNL